MVMGQSIVLSEIKPEVPLENDDPAYQNFLLQRYEERIKSLSHTDRVSKFCMDVGFLSVVEIGQYFMIRNTETLTELTVSQWSSSGVFFKDSTRCSSVKKSNVYC